MGAVRACSLVWARNKIGPKIASHDNARTAPFAVLTAVPPPVADPLFSVRSIAGSKAIITAMYTRKAASEDVLVALITRPQSKCGTGTDTVLAPRIFEADAADFLSTAQVSKREFGIYQGVDEDDPGPDQEVVFYRISGRWFAAISIIDSDNLAQGLPEQRTFS